jgi:adenosyl cobinamide kinase/adenosyl cobinamide phosphate guanylyltransferase
VITLVLGGARSGKSAVAERLVASLGDRVTYLATGSAEPTDSAFAARIAAHRLRRPTSWTTVECGADLASALAAADGVVLVDALGTWLAAHHDFDADAAGLLAALAARSEPTVLVSDEVGLGVHPSTELGGRFRDALGTLNQAVAELADDVLLVVAGRVLPLGRGPG